MSRLNRIPIATLILIATNILAAFASALNPLLIDEWGFKGPALFSWTLITSLFLHANLMHLAGNMLFLAAVGPAVEFAAGSVRFVTVYLAGGIAGVVAHLALSHSNSLLVGASGCIAACVGYYTIRYVSLRVAVAPNVSVPVSAIAALWLFLQALGAFVQIGEPSGGVAYWSHLGGVAVGVLLSLAYRAPSLGSLQLGHEALDRMNKRGPYAAIAAADLHLKNHPNDPRALAQKAEAYRALGDKLEEIETLVHLFEVQEVRELGPVILRLEELRALACITSLRRAQTADKLKAIDPGLSIILLESIANGDADDPQRPDAMLSLALLDGQTGWAARLAKEFPLHPAVEVAKSRGLIP